MSPAPDQGPCSHCEQPVFWSRTTRQYLTVSDKQAECPESPDRQHDEEPFDDNVCGLCGVRRPAPGHTACSTCA